jgi:hypothetical protein
VSASMRTLPFCSPLKVLIPICMRVGSMFAFIIDLTAYVV